MWVFQEYFQISSQFLTPGRRFLELHGIFEGYAMLQRCRFFFMIFFFQISAELDGKAFLRFFSNLSITPRNWVFYDLFFVGYAMLQNWEFFEGYEDLQNREYLKNILKVVECFKTRISKEYFKGFCELQNL